MNILLNRPILPFTQHVIHHRGNGVSATSANNILRREFADLDKAKQGHPLFPDVGDLELYDFLML
jgi:hypothetical protein